MDRWRQRCMHDRLEWLYPPTLFEIFTEMDIFFRLRSCLLREDNESYINYFGANHISPEMMDDLLIDACQNKNQEIIIYLLSHGADRDVQFMGGSSLATYASRCNMVNLMVYLVRNGMDINQKDPDGLTPLHAAIIWGRTEMIRFLVESGADLSARFMGETAASMMADRGFKTNEAG